MKKNILVALAILGVVASAYSQGTVAFVNNASGVVKAPIYGPDPANPNTALQGNTATGLPAGTTVYAGPLLSGANYVAQLWSAPGTVTDETSLQAALPTTTFRTGSAAGFVNLVTATLPNVPKDAPSATLQLRVWDSTGGATWDTATVKGKSPLFAVSAVGGDLNVPASLANLRSFNITGAGATTTPEPSTFALAGLGAAALLIFRRRK